MRCPRCSGCLYNDGESTRCLNCGFHLFPTFVDPYVSPRFMGTSLCEFCSKPREKRRTTCRDCAANELAIHKHGTGKAALKSAVHGEQIAEGFAKMRDRA